MSIKYHFIFFDRDNLSDNLLILKYFYTKKAEQGEGGPAAHTWCKVEGLMDVWVILGQKIRWIKSLRSCWRSNLQIYAFEPQFVRLAIIPSAEFVDALGNNAWNSQKSRSLSFQKWYKTARFLGLLYAPEIMMPPEPFGLKIKNLIKIRWFWRWKLAQDMSNLLARMPLFVEFWPSAGNDMATVGICGHVLRQNFRVFHEACQAPRGLFALCVVVVGALHY